MCGRFVLAKSAIELLDIYAAERWVDTPPKVSYNVAPTNRIATLLLRPENKTEDGKPLPPFHREFYSARWGLIPRWQRQPSSFPLINARIESVLEKPSFKAAAQRRCIVPASGYYEWQTTNDSKQPFFISAAKEAGAELLNLAGFYEWWRAPADPKLHADPDANWLLTVTLVTTDSTAGLREIHDRAPLLVFPESSEEWLNPAIPTDSKLLSKFLLRSQQGVNELSWHPVSRAVGSVKNDSPELIASVNP